MESVYRGKSSHEKKQTRTKTTARKWTKKRDHEEEMKIKGNEGALLDVLSVHHGCRVEQ